jgi:hypothetical protein
MAFQFGNFIPTLDGEPYWPSLNGPTLDPYLPSDLDDVDAEPPFDFTGINLETPPLTPILSELPIISDPATPEVIPETPPSSSEPTRPNTPEVIPHIEINFNHPYLLLALRNHARALQVIQNIVILCQHPHTPARIRQIRLNICRLEGYLNVYPDLFVVHIRVPRLRGAFY